MRFKENKERYGSTTPAPRAAPTYSAPAPRYDSSVRTKADGTPDMRFKENKERYGSTTPAPRPSTPTYTAPARPSGPLKADGTPDMRYKANKEAAAGRTTPANSDRVRTSVDQRNWKKDSNGRYVEPGTGRALNNDGTYDMRRAENRDLKGTVAGTNGRPATATPRNQWVRSGDGRYVEPRTGRALNNDGTYDMRFKGNKDLPNPSARVRIGSDNYEQANRRQTSTRSRHNTVIINNYNTYVSNV